MIPYLKVIVYCSVFLIIFSSKFYLLQDDPEDILSYLGTRTPYRSKSNKNDTKIKFPGCKEKKIWMIVRHGARLPSAKDIVGMKTVLLDLREKILRQQGKGELDREQLHHLESWSSSIVPQQEKFLTQEGEEEMVLLAERMQKRFPIVFKDKFDNDTYLFRYTATQRAQQSAQYFTVGLFDKKDSHNVWFYPASKIDPILRFYKHCDRWQIQVKKNMSTYDEQTKYGLSNEMKENLVSIAKKLGLNEVSLDEASLMYKICGYESSWNKFALSPWCYGFDINSAQAFEYFYDLKHYWMDGYGHPLTSKLACLAVNNMFDNFSDKDHHKATFLFAHSGTLLKILSHLKLFKPEAPLTAAYRPPDRAWKASNIDCFASNLAFVLYECGTEDFVLTLHQERIIKLPMCQSELCSFKELKRQFHESISDCDYKEMCSLKLVT